MVGYVVGVGYIGMRVLKKADLARYHLSEEKTIKQRRWARSNCECVRGWELI